MLEINPIQRIIVKRVTKITFILKVCWPKGQPYKKVEIKTVSYFGYFATFPSIPGHKWKATEGYCGSVSTSKTLLW